MPHIINQCGTFTMANHFITVKNFNIYNRSIFTLSLIPLMTPQTSMAQPILFFTPYFISTTLLGLTSTQIPVIPLHPSPTATL